MTVWTLTESDSGVVVSWRRKTKSFSSFEEALAFVKGERAPADRVVRVEKDGYKSPVTRRRWRGPRM